MNGSPAPFELLVYRHEIAGHGFGAANPPGIEPAG